MVFLGSRMCCPQAPWLLAIISRAESSQSAVICLSRIFCPSLNTLSQSGCGAQLCPVVGWLEPTRIGWKHLCPAQASAWPLVTEGAFATETQMPIQPCFVANITNQIQFLQLKILLVPARHALILREASLPMKNFFQSPRQQKMNTAFIFVQLDP